MKNLEKFAKLIQKKIEASSDNNDDDDDNDLKLERGSMQVHEQAKNDFAEKDMGIIRVPIDIGYEVIRMFHDGIEDARLRRKYKEYQDKYGDDRNGYVNVIFRMDDDKERVMMIYDECYQKYIKKWEEAEAQKASKKTECEPEKEKPKLMIEEEEDYER